MQCLGAQCCVCVCVCVCVWGGMGIWCVYQSGLEQLGSSHNYHSECMVSAIYCYVLLTGYRAVSILSCGNQSLHKELRERTPCELVLNEDFYLQPSIISLLDFEGHEISKKALIGTSASYDRALSKDYKCVDNDVARTVLHLDCLETAKAGSYSNMWHVHAVASVLQRPVTSIYPNKNSRIRPLFNKVVSPRILDNNLTEVSIPLLIMWTTTHTKCNVSESTMWSPNHFVPCFSSNCSTDLECTSAKEQPKLQASPSATSSTLKLKSSDHEFKLDPAIIFSALTKVNPNKKMKHDQMKHLPNKKSTSIHQFLHAVNPPTIPDPMSRSRSLSGHKVWLSSKEEVHNHSSQANSNKCSTYKASTCTALTGAKMKKVDLCHLKPQTVTTMTMVDALSKMHASTFKPANTSKEAQHSSSTIKRYFSPVVATNSVDYLCEPDNQSPDFDQLSSADDDDDDEYSEYRHYISDSDENSNASSTLSDNSMETEFKSTKVMIRSQPQSHPLPFPCLSFTWYKHQHDLAINNAARMRSRLSNTTRKDTKGNVVSVNRCPLVETLEQSIQKLQCHIGKTNSRERKHRVALVQVGEFVLANGPIVKTRDAGNVYAQEKGLTDNTYSAIELYEIFCKHLSLSQVYVFNRAYLVQNTPGLNLDAVVNSLNQMIDKDDIVKEITEQRLKELLLPAMRYMDTPRDKLVLKGLIAELTDNNTFTSSLLGVKSRKGVTSARNKLHQHLSHYQQICKTSQVARNDLTTQQQFRLTQRIISRRKLNEIKVICEGRGRKLKSVQFPELATVLTFAFGEYDLLEGGGGLEAHPRLTTGTLYKSADSCLTMKRAREILLSCAPQGFKISLSSCYNYTENYREGSRQASQHHSG